jgi:hypothetical protein
MVTVLRMVDRNIADVLSAHVVVAHGEPAERSALG